MWACGTSLIVALNVVGAYGMHDMRRLKGSSLKSCVSLVHGVVGIGGCQSASATGNHSRDDQRQAYY